MTLVDVIFPLRPNLRFLYHLSSRSDPRMKASNTKVMINEDTPKCTNSKEILWRSKISVNIRRSVRVSSEANHQDKEIQSQSLGWAN